MAIVIGNEAVNRVTSTYLHTYTQVCKVVAANAAGKITSVEIWLAWSDPNDVWAGTFSASGNVLTCRDSESCGSIAFGSKQTISGLDISVETGDYLGAFAKTAAANIEKDTFGGTGVWSYEGEVIDPTDSQTFTLDSGWEISLYGTGTEAAPPATEAYGYVV